MNDKNVNISTQQKSIGLTTLRDQIEAGESVYALFDSADEPLVPPKVNSLGKSAASLYSGTAATDFSHIAPYIATVDIPLLDWIMDHLSDTPWGYFVFTKPDVNLAGLRKHLRRFLMVSGPDEKELYFRFYDPRVISIFLQSISADIANQFFTPLKSVVLFNEDEQAVRLTPADNSMTAAKPPRFN